MLSRMCQLLNGAFGIFLELSAPEIMIINCDSDILSSGCVQYQRSTFVAEMPSERIQSTKRRETDELGLTRCILERYTGKKFGVLKKEKHKKN